MLSIYNFLKVKLCYTAHWKQWLAFLTICFLVFACSGEDSKKKEENIPSRLIQVWDQSKCKVCDDPWREWNEKIDDYTNLNSVKDEYGDKSMTAESYVLFKNVPLTYAEGYKRNASFKVSYQYYAKNCWGAEWRDANLILGSPGYWSEKNVEWIKNANNGDRFDVLMYQPEFEQKNPSHACDYTSFSIMPANYDKIVVFPAGELNIKKSGNYKFKGSQGDFKLISNNISEHNNLDSKEMAENNLIITQEEKIAKLERQIKNLEQEIYEDSEGNSEYEGDEYEIQPPPPPPEVIEIVEDEEEVEETIIESTESDEELEIEEVEEDVEVPFAVIENVPVFPGCERGNNEEKRKCMSEKIANFVQRKFNTDLAGDLGLTGRQRINAIFKIDKSGNVVSVRARAPHPRLEKEAQRVINLLPKMQPGKHRGKAVIVPYSLPIIFQVQD